MLLSVSFAKTSPEVRYLANLPKLVVTPCVTPGTWHRDTASRDGQDEAASTRHEALRGGAQQVQDIGGIERGQHRLTISALLRIARALGMSGAELMAAAEALLPAAYFSRQLKGRVPSFGGPLQRAPGRGLLWEMPITQTGHTPRSALIGMSPSRPRRPSHRGQPQG